MIATTPLLRKGAVMLSAGVALIFVMGCGDDSGVAKRYAVSGTVTYQGKPLEKGLINFISTKPDGKSAGGDVQNGSYTLTTVDKGDGALPGSYKVTISSVDIDTSKMQAIAKGGQFHHDKAFAEATKNAKSAIPGKYMLPETSGLTADVGEKSNTIDFKLD